MRRYIKNSLRVFGDFGIMLIIFVVFLYAVLSLGKDKPEIWLVVYSIMIFTLLVFMLYGDMRKLAQREGRPQSTIKRRFYDGLIFGLLGAVPVALLELLIASLSFLDPTADTIRQLVLKALMGPFYFIIKMAGNGLAGYVIATLTLPVVSFLGYLAGYFDMEISKYIKPKRKIRPSSQK